MATENKRALCERPFIHQQSPGTPTFRFRTRHVIRAAPSPPLSPVSFALLVMSMDYMEPVAAERLAGAAPFRQRPLC